MSGKASPHDIRRTLDAYGSAFLYEVIDELAARAALRSKPA